MIRPNEDQEITFRVGSFRVHYYPIEGGMSCESFARRHNGHPQGDWLVAHDEEHETADAQAALAMAYGYRNSVEALAQGNEAKS